jgi:hypothetical protein
MQTFRSTFLDSAHKTLIDEVSDTVMYVGDGDVGALTSSPTWAIRRLTTTGNDLAVEYANGTPYFDKVWDNRASYTYS